METGIADNNIITYIIVICRGENVILLRVALWNIFIQPRMSFVKIDLNSSAQSALEKSARPAYVNWPDVNL